MLRIFTTARFCTVRPLLAEHPFTPAQFVSATTAYILRQPFTDRLELVMHPLQLMERGLIAFSYDYFQWSCGRLIEQQPDLNKEEIFLMMRLGNTHQVRLPYFLQHMENELYLRVHRDYHTEIADYDDQVQKDIKEVYEQLEAKSKDYFELIKAEEGEGEEGDKIEGEVEEGGKEEVEEKEKLVISKDERFMIQISQRLNKRTKASKEITFEDLLTIAHFLRAHDSKNLPFLQYLLELLTIKYEQTPIQPALILPYLQSLTHCCSLLLAEYTTNKHLYNPRSIKRIFKFQSLYYEEHLRQIEEAGQGLSNQQLEQVVEEYGKMAIKRRAIRRRIGELVATEVARRGLEETLTAKLIDINRKDEKMKREYRKIMGLPEPITVQSLPKDAIKIEDASQLPSQEQLHPSPPSLQHQQSP